MAGLGQFRFQDYGYNRYLDTQMEHMDYNYIDKNYLQNFYLNLVSDYVFLFEK